METINVPQLDTMQRWTDRGEPSPSGYSYIVTPAAMVQEEETRRLWEPESQEVSWETFSPGNGCISEGRAKASSVDTIMWKETFVGFHLGNYDCQRRGIDLSRGEPFCWLSNTEWSVLKPYNTNNKWELSRLYLYIFTHTHTYTHTHTPDL